MAYTIWQQVIAEFLGMMVAIWLGESLLACELLAKSKGAHMGITGVAIGFGIAFYIPIQMFGHISATLNPCMMFAKWICGKKTTEAWLLLSLADFLGAFCGAVIVWIIYFAHFSVIPEVPTAAKLDKMRYQNTTSKEAYISNPDGKVDTSKPVSIRFSRSQKEVDRRMTLQIRETVNQERFQSVSAIAARGSVANVPVMEENEEEDDKKGHKESSVNFADDTATEKEEEDTDMPEELVAYEKLLIQDQNAKLSVFSTRPAIYNRTTNFIAEIFGTIALTWFALAVEEREFFLPDEEAGSMFTNTQVAFLIGWLVTGCVLSFVGPTGYSANAARDCGPRLAHYVLPIPNKGPSEWHYAVVSFFGPYVGAFFGGLCMVAARQLNHYPEWSWEKVQHQTMFGQLTNIF